MKTHKSKKSDLKNRPAPLIERTENKDQLPKIDLRRRQQNRNLPTEAFLNVLKNEAPQFWNRAEVVGKWVWIQFSEKQPSNITRVLAELGFHWSKRRLAWQNPCGAFTQRSNREPRERYTNYFPADLNRA
jgi:hypothetical protein